MAGMKRYVTYIYSYEDKKKGGNIGFAKIEIRGEDCRIEIHLRGVYAWQGVCGVYLFRENAGDMEGVLLGEMKPLNGTGDFGTVLKGGRIGDTPFGIGDMEGIFLFSEDGRIFMSRWREGNPLEVCRERFRVWQPGETHPEKDAGSISHYNKEKAQKEGISGTRSKEVQKKAAPNPSMEAAMKPSAEACVKPSAEACMEPSAEKSMKSSAEACMEPFAEACMEPSAEKSMKSSAEACMESSGNEENVQATEIPMRNFFPAYDWLEVWEKLTESHPVFTPFENPKAECIQIELKDLRELPKRYWYLGNNSFLLHGFFNYRYLVVGRTEENRWFIGVPGIYQRQERVMAAIFGFPEFIPTAASGEGGEKEEPVNRFGCWCRYMEE